MKSAEYHIKGLLLQVSNKGLVVQVRETMQQPNQHQLTDLPDWMFHSRNAIWLAAGESSMYDRALAGEEIKKKLLAEMPVRINQSIWSQDTAFGKN
ncbi:hypothetical protein L0244_07515 [bacterium]|nr:hypothetical protein [bacterium]